jgi:hypothetical protein
MRSYAPVALFLGILGCAHQPLSGSNLDRASRPAFVSRIEENAGPRSLVFRDDGSYGGKLKKLEPKEADRRLQLKLDRGVLEKDSKEGQIIPSITRFEVADQLRSSTLELLPRERPWLNVINPASVASALESFLVEEVPANAPDYELLKPLGADAVIEIVVEEYGMRSEAGRAGTYVVGYGRMFFLEGGGNVWYRSFRADEVDAKQPHVDPFKVAKNPGIFREHLTVLLKAVAEQFAKDLQPGDRRGGVSVAPDESSTDAPTPKKGERKSGESEDLPAPDSP